MKSIKRMTQTKEILGNNHLLLLKAGLALGAAMLSMCWKNAFFFFLSRMFNIH